MKPSQVLLFILTIFFVLSGISFIFPEEGIKISDEFVLDFVNFDEFINPEKQETVDISIILENTTIEENEADTVAFEEVAKPKLDSVIVDTVKINPKQIYYKPLPLKIDSVVRFLEFPYNDKSILYDFFEELATIKGQEKILRIMHYGDSQIETDRMTKYFRYKLQMQFGGMGPGFVSAVQAYDFKLPMIQNAKGDWHRYVAYGKRDTSVKHRRYGVLANFCRFSPIIQDTNFLKNKIINPELKYKASLNFSPSIYAYKNSRKYKNCNMFFGNNTTKINMKVYADENLITNEILDSTKKLKRKTWDFEKTPEKLKFEFEGDESPEFYGFAFDGNSGIAVDNIAMRGSNGLIFTKMDLQLLAEFYKILNTKLLILQFGGNVVPSKREDYNFYRKRFSRQLKALKNIAPEMTIIVIGLADMSKKEQDLYVSYPNIVLIRDALKQATFENKCVYWDMYEAMGGENSMPSWVFREPPLAEKDFIHFTPRGAKIIAKMFYNAFIYEYNLYLKKRK